MPNLNELPIGRSDRLAPSGNIEAAGSGRPIHFTSPQIPGATPLRQPEHVNTGIVLPLSQHRLIREAARGRQRAASGHGRASVSALLSDLIERHRAELESDARRAAPDEDIPRRH